MTNMEKLKRDALRLALWYILVMIISFAAGYMVGPAYPVRPMVSVAIISNMTFVIYYSFWIMFLKDFRELYESNESMPQGLRSGFIRNGLLAALFITVAIAILYLTILPDNAVVSDISVSDVSKLHIIERIDKTVTAFAIVLTACAYFMFSKMTGKNSFMHILTVILGVLTIVYVAFVVFYKSMDDIFSLILIVVEYVMQFIFFWKIHKGYEFPSPHE